MKEIIVFYQNNPWTGKVLWTVAGLFFVVILSRLVNRILYKTIKNTNTFYMAKKGTYYFLSIIFALYVLFLWLDMAGSFTTYIGLLSAGIAIALKDLFSNIAAWFFIIIKRPFIVGDRIMIGSQRGDVIDIRLFQFSLMEISSLEDGEQSTGRIVDVPNHFVFIHPVTNYVKGFKHIWNEIKVELTFESNWKKAKMEFEKIVNQHSIHLTEQAEKHLREAGKKYLISYNKLTPIVYTDVKASGVQLTLRYLCVPRQLRKTVNDIWEDILLYIQKEDDVELAYPTRRVVN